MRRSASTPPLINADRDGRANRPGSDETFSNKMASIPRRQSSIVHGRVEFRKQHAGEPEATEIAHPHRIEHPHQMVALVLHHARMKALGFALNRSTARVDRK